MKNIPEKVVFESKDLDESVFVKIDNLLDYDIRSRDRLNFAKILREVQFLCQPQMSITVSLINDYYRIVFSLAEESEHEELLSRAKRMRDNEEEKKLIKRKYNEYENHDRLTPILYALTKTNYSIVDDQKAPGLSNLVLDVAMPR